MKLLKPKSPTIHSPADLHKVEFAVFAYLPNAYKTPDKKYLEPESIQRRLSALARFPVRQLVDASHILSSLNRMTLKAEKRLELTTRILKQIYPVISQYYFSYQGQKNSLPEKTDRRESLIASINVIQQFAISYKHLFREVFTSEAKHYKKVRKGAYDYGFRILEMLLIEQRLRALRYQQLPRNAWQDSNQVFFAMALHNDFYEHRAMNGFIGIKKRERHHGPGYVLERNILQLYLSIQLFGVLDVSTWPTNLFHVPDTYMEYLNPGIIVSGDDGQPIKEGSLLTWLNNDDRPVFIRPDKLNGPAILLDYTPINNILVKDYETIASMKFIGDYDSKKLSRPLQKVKEEERVPVLQMMLSALRKRERRTQRHAVFKDNILRVYFGFGEVVRLLTEIYGGELSRLLRSQDMTNFLAESSAILTDSGKSSAMSRWQILNFSAGGILISTVETDFSKVVSLGQLLAFVPNEETKQPSIGYVCRLNRPEDQVVEVGISRLANYAEVIVIEGVVREDGIKMPAILTQDSSDNWQLIVPPKDELLPGLPIRLVRNSGTAPARLGDVYLTKKGFTVFELRSPGIRKQPLPVNR